MAQHKFKTILIGHGEMTAAGLKPPFDVPEVFGRKGRVPVKGTINGFPYDGRERRDARRREMQSRR